MLTSCRSLRWLLTSASLPFLLTTTTLTTTGCPGDGDGDAGVELDPAARVAAAFGDYYETCYTADGLVELIEPGREDVYDSIQPADYRAWLEAQLVNDNVAVDEAAAIACAEAYEARIADADADGCTQTFDEDEAEACNTAFSGTVEPGGTCVWTAECAEGYCLIDEDGCGTCAGYAGEGESCAGGVNCDYNLNLSCNDNDICVAPLQEGDLCTDADGSDLGYCDYDAGLNCDYYETYRCVAPLDEGEACRDEDFNYLGDCDWRAGLECDFDTGLCVPGAQEGESCLDLGCGLDLYCDYDLEDPVCVAEVEPIEPEDGIFDEGDACTADYYDGCDAYLTALACVDDDGDGEGVCTPIVAVDEGEACGEAYDYNSERWCLHGFTTHYCEIAPDAEEGTCQPRPTAGESCAFASCDYTSTCVYDSETFESTCQALPGVGEPCVNASCASDATCEGYDWELDEPGTCVAAISWFEAPVCMADGS